MNFSWCRQAQWPKCAKCTCHYFLQISQSRKSACNWKWMILKRPTDSRVLTLFLVVYLILAANCSASCKSVCCLALGQQVTASFFILSELQTKMLRSASDWTKNNANNNELKDTKTPPVIILPIFEKTHKTCLWDISFCLRKIWFYVCGPEVQNKPKLAEDMNTLTFQKTAHKDSSQLTFSSIQFCTQWWCSFLNICRKYVGELMWHC